MNDGHLSLRARDVMLDDSAIGGGPMIGLRTDRPNRIPASRSRKALGAIGLATLLLDLPVAAQTDIDIDGAGDGGAIWP
jgi:hypothetical protein